MMESVARFTHILYTIHGSRTMANARLWACMLPWLYITSSPRYDTTRYVPARATAHIHNMTLMCILVYV